MAAPPTVTVGGIRRCREGSGNVVLALVGVHMVVVAVPCSALDLNPIPRLFHSSSAMALMDSDGVLTSGDVPVNEVVVVGISWEVGGIVPLTVLVGAG